MNHSYTLICPSIILSPMNLMECEEYRLLRNRDENRNWFVNKKLITKENQIKWYSRYLNDESEFMFTIKNRDIQSFIGGIGIYNINLDNGSAEIGRIIVDKSLYSGNGYGCEAIKSLFKFANESLGLTKLYAEIYINNEASKKSFYHAGFKLNRNIELRDGLILVEKYRT